MQGKKILKEVKKFLMDFIKQQVEYDKAKRKPTWLTGKLKNGFTFERVVENNKRRFHCELCLCGGENVNSQKEGDYLNLINTLILYGKILFDECHLFEYTYDVLDDIWYAHISIVINKGE